MYWEYGDSRGYYSGQMAHEGSLRETEMVRRDSLETYENDIKSVSEEKEIGWEDGREWAGVAEKAFAILVTFFCIEAYGITEIKGSENFSLFTLRMLLKLHL